MASPIGASSGAAVALVPDVAAVAQPTLTDLAKTVNLDPEVASALWEHLDLDPLLDMEVASAIPPAVLDESITAFVRDSELSAGAAGRISLLFSKLRALSSAPVLAPPPLRRRRRLSPLPRPQFTEASFRLFWTRLTTRPSTAWTRLSGQSFA